MVSKEVRGGGGYLKGLEEENQNEKRSLTSSTSKSPTRLTSMRDVVRWASIAFDACSRVTPCVIQESKTKKNKIDDTIRP